jgi:hypothetical protein
VLQFTPEKPRNVFCVTLAAHPPIRDERLTSLTLRCALQVTQTLGKELAICLQVDEEFPNCGIG